MDKGTFLDIEELIVETKKKERMRLDLFKEQLARCHRLIREKNKARIKGMRFTLPLFVMGKPVFDVNVLRNYVCHHLRENGFLVKELDTKTLFISWDESDLDLQRFQQTKEKFKKEFNEVYMVDNGGGGNFEVPNVSFTTMQQRQQAQQQQKAQREARLAMQRDRFAEQGTFYDFMKRW